MKRILMLLSLVLLMNHLLFAQPKPKPEEAPPTKKEMEEMMKQAQQMMDEMSPEDKAEMESMGIKMPNFSAGMPNVSDAELAQAFEDDARIVPKKDNGRIGAISKTPLTKATMPGFLSSSHSQVIQQLKPDSRAKGEEIYQMVKAEYNSANATGNSAASLWMMGKPQLAIYLMGKACMDDPENANNLNNYGAMLSMCGAEQLAVPILENINKKFPKNSTILNNIGQAWFGLGDIDKATAYLDSTIGIYPRHPQANYTKSYIEESKGNTESAIQHTKQSIEEGYSMDKAQRLEKLGHKLNSKDLNWNAPMPQDPLGLEKFAWPEYPKTGEKSEVLELRWNSFIEVCEAEIASLEALREPAETAMLEAMEKRNETLIANIQKGIYADPLPPLTYKAMAKLGYLVSDNDGHIAFQTQQKNEAVAKALEQVAEFERKLEIGMSKLNEKYKDSFGEGKPNPFEAACNDANNIINEYLNSSNSLLEEVYKDYLKFNLQRTNDMIYYSQYTMWPEDFELAKIEAKIGWLNMIKSQKVKFHNRGTWCEFIPPPKTGPFKLSEFDDVHCEYHSHLWTPMGTIDVDCSKMTTKLDLKVVKLGLKEDLNKETFADQFVSCTVEVGASIGEKIEAGPIQVGVSVSGGVGVEIDRTGIKDVTVKVGASVGVSTNIPKPAGTTGKESWINKEPSLNDGKLKVGVEGKVSLISGKTSVESTGILKGVFKK